MEASQGFVKYEVIGSYQFAGCRSMRPAAASGDTTSFITAVLPSHLFRIGPRNNDVDTNANALSLARDVFPTIDELILMRRRQSLCRHCDLCTADRRLQPTAAQSPTLAPIRCRDGDGRLRLIKLRHRKTVDDRDERQHPRYHPLRCHKVSER